MVARAQTGNGAKFWPDGSAIKASVAGVRLAKICHFRRPFLWFISFGRTKEPSRTLDMDIGSKLISASSPKANEL
jgi:hypothetical protein